MFTPKDLNNYIKTMLQPFVEPLGFTKWESNSQGGSFSKKNKSINYSMGYGFLTYDHYKIGKMNAFIAFPTLEKLVMPVLADNQLHGKMAPKDYITHGLGLFQNDFKELIDIKELSDLDPVIAGYKKNITENFLPYFDRFSDLNKFYHALLKNQDPNPSTVSLETLFYEFKLATIYRLCNDDRYESVITNYSKMLQEHLDEDINYRRCLKGIQDLKVILDKTKPIYNL